MPSDISRNTFDPRRQYTSVRLQQGRVITDADWNEQADITRYRAERALLDLVGPCGAPAAAAGFALAPGTQALALRATGKQAAWVAGEDGVVLSTGDNGATWQVHQPEVYVHLRALGVAGDFVWAAGDDGVVARWSDHARTWSVQHLGARRALRAMAVFDAANAWIVGDGGIVLRTADCGDHWTPVETGAARLHAVHFVDLLNGVAVGDHGTILASSDGGLTWVARPAAPRAHLRAVAFTDADSGWVAGDDGTLLQTQDRGLTWSDRSNREWGRLNAIALRDANEGYVAGEGGVFLGSLDGGANWGQVLLGRGDSGSNWRALALAPDGPLWGAGDASEAVRLDAPSAEPQHLNLPPASVGIGAGRYYVQGAMCELDQRASYYNQPFGKRAPPLRRGTYLWYLHAWERDLTCLSAPHIREVALGGPDTATRVQTVWQVRALPVSVEPITDARCDLGLSEWEDMLDAPAARLAARAEPRKETDSLCEIAAAAGYRRLENQLYRVEIHEGGDRPSFKWSRENGSVAFPVLAVTTDRGANRTIIRLGARGRDANLDLAASNCVELVDDSLVAERAGALFEYIGAGDDESEVVLAGVLPDGVDIGNDATRHPLLRRWDQPVSGAVPLRPGDWIDLEDGVQVYFEPGGTYRPGHYWQVAARTITGDVEWPRDDGGHPLALPAAGAHDAYCRLGLVDIDKDGLASVAADCRIVFPPLGGIDQLLYVSGDGQEALPGAVLPLALVVRVARGSVPVAGARIRFMCEHEDARVGPEGDTANWEVQFVATADYAGVVSCGWQLTGQEKAQHLYVDLLDSNDEPRAGQHMVFGAIARLAGAATVACELTVGRDGQVKQLTSDELAGLLARSESGLSLCLLPEVHMLDELQVDAGGTLTLRGCGGASLVLRKGPLRLTGFQSLEIRDLALHVNADVGLDLSQVGEVALRNLHVTMEPPAAAGVRIGKAARVLMTDCVIETGADAVGFHLGAPHGECHLARNRLRGMASFYGEPAGPLEQAVLDKLVGSLAVNDNLVVKPVNGAHLYFSANTAAGLTVGQATREILATNKGAVEAFSATTVNGNTFTGLRSLFVGNLVSFTANSFAARLADGALTYALVAANRATATGNLAAAFASNAATVQFRTPAGGFSDAANQW